MPSKPLKYWDPANSQVSRLGDSDGSREPRRNLFASLAQFSLRNTAYWTGKFSLRSLRRSAEPAEAAVADRLSRRIAAIDVARGIALCGMGVYHLSWDLAYFGLAPPNLPYTPGMRIFSHVVASAFLALVGVSLAIAHRDGPRWGAFLVRLATVAGAAALVSVAHAVGGRRTSRSGSESLHCIFGGEPARGAFANSSGVGRVGRRRGRR